MLHKVLLPFGMPISGLSYQCNCRRSSTGVLMSSLSHIFIIITFVLSKPLISTPPFPWSAAWIVTVPPVRRAKTIRASYGFYIKFKTIALKLLQFTVFFLFWLLRPQVLRYLFSHHPGSTPIWHRRLVNLFYVVAVWMFDFSIMGCSYFIENKNSIDTIKNLKNVADSPCLRTKVSDGWLL